MKVIRKRNKQSAPHFYLRHPKSNAETPILLYYKFNKQLEKRLTYSTGQVINPKYWNENKERAKPSVVFDYKRMNLILDKIIAQANELVQDEQILNIVEFRNKLDDFMGRDYFIADNETIQTLSPPTFVEWVNTFIINETSWVDSSIYTINKSKSELKKLW